MSRRKAKAENVDEFAQPVIYTEDSAEDKKAKLIRCLTEFCAMAYVAWTTIPYPRYGTTRRGIYSQGTVKQGLWNLIWRPSATASYASLRK